MNNTSKDNKLVLDSVKAREIVREVMDFGVNQFQIKKIIKFLSLELEDRSLMQKISLLIDEEVEDSCSDHSKAKIEI